MHCGWATVSFLAYCSLFLNAMRKDNNNNNNKNDNMKKKKITFMRWSTLARSCVLIDNLQYNLSPGLATRRCANSCWDISTAHLQQMKGDHTKFNYHYPKSILQSGSNPCELLIWFNSCHSATRYW